MGSRKFYAVAKGRNPGIYTAWYGDSGAERQIRGFKGARYKGFASRQEAEAWIKEMRPGSASSNAGKKQVAQEMETVNDPVTDETIIVYTDGGCLNNPGPGGYGVVIKDNTGREELSGGYRLTTNNRMELTACIVGLRQFRKRKKISIYSDSKYVVDGITKGWARSWRKRNWRKSDGQPALNPDLWAELLELCELHDVSFHWVKGHAGNPENERCDTLANTAARQSGLPEDDGYRG